MSKGKATKGTQVSKEGGKASWVLPFTHFHIRRIKKIVTPIKHFLRNNGSLEGDREKWSSKETGKLESRVNPLNFESSQNSK